MESHDIILAMIIKETPKKKERIKEDSNKVEEAQKELSPLQKHLQKSDVLLMLYPKDSDGYFSENISEKDEITVYKLLKEKGEYRKSLIILLDTSGGNVFSAVKIMDLLRTKYDEITIAVPQKAKSSGTMMCCGADKLIMGPISELGPLDKPMIHPNNETARISALDIVKSIDGMLDIAKDREITLAKELNKEFGLPIHKSLSLSSDSISKLISPMLCNEDVKIYNQAQRLLQIAENYGKELLRNFMLKYIESESLRDRLAVMIVRRLVWLYPDHSFAIRRNELRNWFFIVEDAEKLDYWDELWKEYEQNIGTKRGTIIKFMGV